MLPNKYYTPLKQLHHINNLSIFCGTWNIGNSSPPTDLTSWIPVGCHDLYVMAVQECKYEPRYDFNTCRDDWINTLSRHLDNIILY